MNVTTPECSFSNIIINNKTQGLYLAIEGLQTSYLERNYGTDSGNLYKAEGTETNLVYSGEEQSNYSGLKNNSVKDITDDDFQKIVYMIKNLNTNSANLSNYIDIDATLKYFAVSSALVNLDSYQCNMYHNYYIYEKDGICTILPWDLNLSFGGFTGGGSNKDQLNKNHNVNNTDNTHLVNNATSLICYPIDEPTSTSMEDSPLLSKLLEVDEFKEKYHDYLQQIVNEYFNGGIFKSKLYSAATLIDSYVETDPTSFYGYEQFTQSIDELFNFGKYRAESILLQLSGEIPSTKEEQSKVDLSKYFSNNIVNMNILGTMGGAEMKSNDIPNNSNIQPHFENTNEKNENFNDVKPPDMNNTQLNEFDNNQFSSQPSFMNDTIDDSFVQSSNTEKPGIPPNKNNIGDNKNPPNMQQKDSNFDNNTKEETSSSTSIYSIKAILPYFIIITVALIFSLKFKRRKYTI